MAESIRTLILQDMRRNQSRKRKVLIHGHYWSTVSDIPGAKGTNIRMIRVEHLKTGI
jgi:hypothetical protein